MPHLPNPRSYRPILLTASLALIAAACSPSDSQTMLGDRVWRDEIHNGLQDPAEPGVEDVTVELYQADGVLVASTTTDQEGAYGFADLRAGRYFLTFVPHLAAYGFTLENAGDDDGADSDADPLTGRTEVFEFDTSQPDLRWDAGLVLAGATATPQPPPPEPPKPTPTPVVPATGGTYRFKVTFVRVSGDCGFPDTFVDTVDFNIAAASQTTTGQTTIVSQPSTSDRNTGQTLPNGEGEASSERESYTYTLAFELDETGKVVRVIVKGVNTYTDANGCVTVYEIEGEAKGEIEGQ